jgi:DNA-binding CsgD family transcriptional regulator
MLRGAGSTGRRRRAAAPSDKCADQHAEQGRKRDVPFGESAVRDRGRPGGSSGSVSSASVPSKHPTPAATSRRLGPPSRFGTCLTRAGHEPVARGPLRERSGSTRSVRGREDYAFRYAFRTIGAKAEARYLRGMYEALTKTLPALTKRQQEVVELIAAGCSNEEVGERLGISPRTAKAHSDVLRQKLGVARRRQIPVAYRLLTGEDPLAKSLGPIGPGG